MSEPISSSTLDRIDSLLSDQIACHDDDAGMCEAMQDARFVIKYLRKRVAEAERSKTCLRCHREIMLKGRGR